MRLGYKSTEVGVIPEDWNQTTIRDIATKVGSGVTPTGGSKRYKEYGRPFVRSQNVGWGSLLLDDLAFIDEETHDGFPATELKRGDILLNITGASIGRTALADEMLVGGNVNQHVCIIRSDTNKAVPKFVNLLLLSVLGQCQIDSFQAGGNRQGLNFSQINSIKILLPSTKTEQEAIAEALSDADALIESLEQLLVKKRQLKHGAMQELLTGKKRLPGFSGEWEVKRLWDVCYMKSGQGITNADIDEFSEFSCYGGNGLRGFSKQYTHDGSYALIGRQGALCGNVLSVDGRFFASEHAIVVTPQKETDIHWLSYILARMNLNQYSESSAQPGLSVSKLLALECMVPRLPEQTAIATILSDMDAEIAVLEAKLAKARQLKQSMMQELLTGRIRLV